MGILNSGYTRPTGFVWRISYEAVAGRQATVKERVGGAGAVSSAGHAVRFSSWCPKVIAAIGHLHPTLASRCIVIRMQRKAPGEECERLKRLEATEFKRKCAWFVADHAEAIARAEPEIPRGLANRAADVWEPLLVLADLAGGAWPNLAREAALGLTARAQEHSPIGSLLMDILLRFTAAKTERVFSRDLVGALEGCGERPWLELRKGKKLTEGWLAQQLRPYGVRPRMIRIGEQVARGYVEEEMMETFRRYIPKSEVEAVKAELAEKVVKRKQAKPSQGGGEQNGAGVSPTMKTKQSTKVTTKGSWRAVVVFA